MSCSGRGRTHCLTPRRTRLRRSDIAFVFQSFELIDHKTVVENVAVPLLLQRLPRSVADSRAQSAVDSVGLGNRAHTFPQQLSGGERQRVSIAARLRRGEAARAL